jgi:hypothetical protein
MEFLAIAFFKLNFRADRMIFTPATKEGKVKEYGFFEKQGGSMAPPSL